MKPDYSVVDILDSSLVGIISDEWGLQLWASMKVRKKEKQCAICGLSFKELKSNQAFRPLTNSGNRRERICLDCIEDLIYNAMKKKII